MYTSFYLFIICYNFFFYNMWLNKKRKKFNQSKIDVYLQQQFTSSFNGLFI